MSWALKPHPLTSEPTKAWKKFQMEQKCMKIRVKPPTKPPDEDKVRFVCMSDTHSLTHKIRFPIPEGDVFLHAGDFTRCGTLKEVSAFNEWIGSLPHSFKVVIAGNHELSFDPKMAGIVPRGGKSAALSPSFPALGNPQEELLEAIESPSNEAKRLLTNCFYLEDQGIELFGLKIYGTPWQPEYCGWAFNLPRGQPLLDKWNAIPTATDILLTHSPPLGHGDLASSGVRAGCVELLASVQQRIKPLYHVFGHIHEGAGVTTDGQVIYANAATCDVHYRPTNPPVCFDVPLPPGVDKATFRPPTGP